jgi:hypothetical protein
MRTINSKIISKASWLLLVFTLLFSCHDGANYSEELKMSEVDVDESFEAVETMGAEETPIMTFKPDATATKTPTDLKIIKTASARYKVKDVKVATGQIRAISLKYDAYISDLRYENNLYQKENRLTIKVPQQHFDLIMDSIGKVVEFVEYENITTKDVTEKYVDLQGRLATKLEVKKRYEEILRRNAKTVKDILDTEEKLRVLQEEIESAQGRLKYLTNRVAYSTIQIDLYETVEYTEKPTSYEKTFGDKTKEGLSFGWNMIEAIILFFIHIWPLILFGLILGFLIRRWLKK